MLPSLVLLTLLSSPDEPLREEAAALSPLFESRLAKEWVAGTKAMPAPTPRVLFRDVKGNFLTVPEAAARSKEERGGLRKVRV
ncbi:hypothetical protein EON81_29950, partial [bacterium]